MRRALTPGDIFMFTGVIRRIPTYATVDYDIIDQTGEITCDDVVLCVRQLRHKNKSGHWCWCVTQHAAGWVCDIRTDDINVLCNEGAANNDNVR
jgi:hypothetical protein